MMRRARIVLASAICAGLAACVVNLSFDMRRTLQAVSGPGNVVKQTVVVDLSQYAEVQQHKGNIESISLDSADAAITAVNKGGSSAHLNGTLSLRPDEAPPDGSQDVLVGSLTNVPVTVGQTVHLAGSPQLDQLLLNALHGTGRFIAVVSGSSDAAIDCTVDVTVHTSIAYDAGLF